MKFLVIKPYYWPCTLAECPPGFFVVNDALCFKTEYSSEKTEAYVGSGEYFAGGAVSKEDRENIMVQPVVAVWEEVAL